MSDSNVVGLTHDESNTMWYARVTIDLRKNTGICIVANVKKEDTPKWIGKIAEAAKGK